MSAIAGLVRYGGDPDCRTPLARMLAAQAVYGPHGSAEWSDQGVAMGRRLHRTLPEDLHDRQPVIGGDGAIVLVADIRIDNRNEMVTRLGLNGEGARQLSDAALLLKAIERDGEDAIARTVGPFACALWFVRERRLILARDFCGLRPLHYHRGEGFLAFASMPKGLHALADVPYAADEDSVARRLMRLPLGESATFFHAIERVRPGDIVMIDAARHARRRYWNPAPPQRGALRFDDAVEGLRHHLDEAVKSSLRGAGGVVAAELSAGLDSSAVATATAILHPGQVAAFTAAPRQGYDDAPASSLGDESALAAKTAALYPNIEHVIVRGNARSPLAELDAYAYFSDTPSANVSNRLWIDAVDRAAQARGLTVLLSGAMGNVGFSYGGHVLLAELLGQGRILRFVGESRAMARAGWSLGKIASAGIAPYLPAAIWLWGLRLFDPARVAAAEESRAFNRQISPTGAPHQQVALRLAGRPSASAFNTRRTAFLAFDPGNNRKADLARFGVDRRDALCDRRLVEYALSLPTEFYLRDGESRVATRRALRGRVPHDVLSLRRFGYQGADWHEGLSAADVREELARLRTCPAAERVLDLARLEALTSQWPQSGWNSGTNANAYRFALLQGLAAGRFLRRVGAGNA